MIYDILRGISSDYIVFGYVNTEKIKDIGTCYNKCENDSCIKRKEQCVLKIPRKNLLQPNLLNYILYHTKLADEMVRIYRIRSFILEPNKYLNMSSYDYIVTHLTLVMCTSTKIENINKTHSNYKLQMMNHQEWLYFSLSCLLSSFFLLFSFDTPNVP